MTFNRWIRRREAILRIATAQKVILALWFVQDVVSPVNLLI